MQHRTRKQAASPVAFLCAALIAAAPLAQAQTTPDHGSHPMNMPAAAPARAMVPGEVRKVDKPSGKVTIRHGEIKHLNMGAMTMVFRVQDPAMLDALKEGDKISFDAEMVKGVLTLTKVMPAP